MGACIQKSHLNKLENKSIPAISVVYGLKDEEIIYKVDGSSA